MCGIFAVVGDTTNRAAQTTLEGLKKLEYRGYDSWGVAVVPTASSKLKVERSKLKNLIHIKKRVGKIGEANVDDLPASSIAIGHTRWATHGGVTDENAHPHMDCTGRLVVIHNGIVENYQELKNSLSKKGHRFQSETDTEVIAHLLEEEVKKKDITEATMSVFKKLIGSNAIGVLDARSETVIACRNGSPLVAGIGDGQYFLASDVTPFLKFTKRVLFIADGEAVQLTKKALTLFDIQTGKEKKPTIETVDWDAQDAQKSGFAHYLHKEISEQKITVPKTATINKEAIGRVAQQISDSTRVVIIACGTASYAGLAAQYFFAQSGIEAKAYGAYEYLPFNGFVDHHTVVFAISQSGETADTLIATRACKKKGAYVVAVVNARGSTLERESDSVLSVGAGPEIAVVSTKAFTAQLSTMYLISQACRGLYREASLELQQLGKKLSAWHTKKLEQQIIDVAKKLMNQNDIYIIGKHISYPAALECALKIKESSYLHAEAFAAGELKHGVITLIQKGTPCMVVGASDETQLEVQSSAAELKARGGLIIGVAPYTSVEFDIHIPTPDAGALTIIPNVIVGQLLGYYLGIGRGTDPDKPRNLAKSVTVK